MKNRRKFTITIGAILMVCMLFTGYAAVAAEYGSESDPLITQSYLEQVLTPSLEKTAQNTAQSQASAYKSSMEQKILELSQSLDNKIASVAAKISNSSQSSSDSPTDNKDSISIGWEKIELQKDQYIRLDMNSEVILRSGTAICIESAGTGLTDLSGGNVLRADEDLAVNHRYKTTTNGAGLTATSSATIFISGGYSLS